MRIERNDALEIVLVQLAQRLNELQHLHDDCRGKIAVIHELSGVAIGLGAPPLAGLEHIGSTQNHKSASLSCYELAGECRQLVFGGINSENEAG